MSGFVGAGDGIRTRDLYLGKVSLYQLSHSRNSDDDYSTEKEKMQTRRKGAVEWQNGLSDRNPGDRNFTPGYNSGSEDNKYSRKIVTH